MNGCPALKPLLGRLAAAACGSVISLNLAVAGIQDSRFDFSADRANIEFEVRDVPRREVLSRLFAGTGVEIRWSNPSFADEAMSGTFSGSAAAVARELLAQMNYVIVHDGRADDSRPVQIVVVGSAKGERSSTGLAAIDRAMQPAPHRRPALAEATPARRNGLGMGPATDSSTRAAPSLGRAELGTTGDATGLLKPPAPGETAPPLVASPGTEAPSLIPPKEGEAPPPLKPELAGNILPFIANPIGDGNASAKGGNQ